MNPSEIIRETKNVLFELGWHQGDFEGPDGSVCVRGALRLAAMNGSFNWKGEYSDDECRAAEHVRGVVGEHIPTWNDAIGRTFSEIIDGLDLAEKRAMIAEEQDDQHQA
jgi:hypothetical protein